MDSSVDSLRPSVAEVAQWVVAGLSLRDVYECGRCYLDRDSYETYDANVLGLALIGKLGNPQEALNRLRGARSGRAITERQALAELLGLPLRSVTEMSLLHLRGQIPVRDIPAFVMQRHVS